MDLKSWSQAKEKKIVEHHKDLFFVPASTSSVGEEALVPASTLLDKIVQDLVCLPWGVSLRNWSVWVTLLDSDLLGCLHENAEAIANARKASSRSFVICPLPGLDDCFLVPVLEDHYDEATKFRVENDSRSRSHNAAIALSIIHKHESLQYSESDGFSSNQNNDLHIRKLLDFLMEFKAKHGIDSLLEEVLAISLSLPSETESIRLLHTLLINLMKISSSGEDLQSLLIDFCRGSSSTLSSELIGYRRLLVHFSSKYGSEFPKFRDLLLSSTVASAAQNGVSQDFWISRREEIVVDNIAPTPVTKPDVLVKEIPSTTIQNSEEEEEDFGETIVLQPKQPENSSLSSPVKNAPTAMVNHSNGYVTPATGVEQHDFINQLLRRKFDYDESMNPPPASHPMLITLNESLELLASKLYSSDVHFVMELIQNADDNHYHNGVDPSIHFIFDSKTNTGNKNATLMIMNNEVGFSERNVEAICEIGKSTKKNKSGYIGQKGIG